MTSRVRALAGAALLVGAAALAPIVHAQTATGVDYSTARFDRKLVATLATGVIDLDGSLDEPGIQRLARGLFEGGEASQFPPLQRGMLTRCMGLAAPLLLPPLFMIVWSLLWSGW